LVGEPRAALELPSPKKRNPESVGGPATVQAMTANEESVRVGQVQVSLETATAWVREYTDVERNKTSANPYAYPAYDRFDGGTERPDRLTDADLLAPVLLNVGVKVRSFYGLQRIRGRLEDALSNEELARPLTEIDENRIEDLVHPLYAVLDDPPEQPWNVRGTTLSKILHRKRPQSLVLHDRWVRACYFGDRGPVRRARDRTWARYMIEITAAIRADILSQPRVFEALDRATGAPGALTHIRLLDILAWKSRGDAPVEAPDEEVDAHVDG
jgi:hypothetical protein